MAHTSGDVPLAIRTFLMVVDMTDDEDAPTTSYQTDITLRAWYGVKLVCRARVVRRRKLMPSAEFTPPDVRGTVAVSDCTPKQP